MSASKVLLILVIATTIATYAFASIKFMPGMPDSSQVIKMPQNDPDPWLGRDKGLHFVGSMMTVILASKTMTDIYGIRQSRAVNYAAGFSLSLGLVKEIRDEARRGNHFCWKDLSADLAGIAAGMLLLGVK